MFPANIEGEFRIGDIDAEEAERRLTAFEEWLRGAKATDIEREGDTVTFRAGIFRWVSNWNPLVPIGWGRVELSRAEGVLRYDFSCRQLLVLISVWAVVGAAGCALAGFWTGSPLVAPIMGVWLFGMNYLMASWRLSKVLREKLGPAVEPEPPRPPTRF